MSQSEARRREFEAALAAAQRPLDFAAAGDFEKLERVRGLEEAVRQALERAIELAPSAAAKSAVAAVLGSLPAPERTRAERVTALRAALNRLADLRAHNQAPQRPPSPRSTAGVRPMPLADVREQPAEAEPGVERGARQVNPLAPELGPAAVRPPVVADDAPAPEAFAAESSSPRRLLPMDASVQYLKGVGPKLAELLQARQLRTVEDLLRFLPRRYEDRRGSQRIADLQVDTVATVEGIVKSKHIGGGPGGRRRLEVIIGDSSGAMVLTWFRFAGRGFAERFVTGRRVRVSGQVKRYRGKLQMAHPETKMLDAETLGRETTDPSIVVGAPEKPADALVPLYLEVEGMRPQRLRAIIGEALPSLAGAADPLPKSLRERHALPGLEETIRALHDPPAAAPLAELDAGTSRWHRRLIYEELLLLQLAVLRRKARSAAEPGKSMPLTTPLSAIAGELFSFSLTRAQHRVLTEIESDLRRDLPMHRLLQGDVGSGKTAVAVSAAAAVARAGYQAAIMAPTEILAEQHARVALATLTKGGIRVALLTGTAGDAERREVLSGLRSGTIQVVVGTHALISDGVEYEALGLAVVDEQHRFGVRQRAQLVALGRAGLGVNPHTLVMTATPIPRTLALTLYGDLDLSIIDELPPGRQPIRTELFREKQRAQVYERVRRQVEQGRQAYVVFPLVEESDKEGMARVRDATSAAQELASGPLAGLRLGLLHGRMTGDEKDAVMRRFIGGDIQVLVATTVIEVGIDVANATVMVIEHAERFGLSQLHQLRGRVGRGVHRSECFLLSQYTPSEEAWTRLEAMTRTNDGFLLAEQDLKLRGPGDVVGVRQSGVPMLSYANLVRDHDLLKLAHDDAAALLSEDARLEKAEHRELAALLQRQWEEKLELAQIG